MATAAWNHEKAYAEWEELLKRAATREEADKIATANQLNSPLLRLPGEIRTYIYIYVCLGTTIKHEKRSDYNPGACFVTQTFLLTCNQFYREALVLLYKHATFVFGDGDWLAHSKFNPDYHSLITSFSLDKRFLVWVPEIMDCEKFWIRRRVFGRSERLSISVEKVHVPSVLVDRLLKRALKKLFERTDLQIIVHEAAVAKMPREGC